VAKEVADARAPYGISAHGERQGSAATAEILRASTRLGYGCSEGRTAEVFGKTLDAMVNRLSSAPLLAAENDLLVPGLPCEKNA
jgi:hypothetical protein